MLSLIARLFALRPLLSIAIFGIPVLLLIAVGLLTIVVLKSLIFIVLPIAFCIWLYRRLAT